MSDPMGTEEQPEVIVITGSQSPEDLVDVIGSVVDPAGLLTPTLVFEMVSLTDPGYGFWAPDGHGSTVGAEGTIVEPGGIISDLIEAIPSGHTFGAIHDGWVGDLAPEDKSQWGLLDWAINIATMPIAVSVALSLEIINATVVISTIGLVEAPFTHVDP